LSGKKNWLLISVLTSPMGITWPSTSMDVETCCWFFSNIAGCIETVTKTGKRSWLICSHRPS
jgi:hypothetical protein